MRVVVIGGGVVGLACGCELLRRGAEVTIVDMGELGGAASWGNAGWVTPSFSTPLPAPGLVRSSIGMMVRADSPLYLRPQLEPAFARWLWTFSRHCNPSAYRRGMAALAALNRRTYELFDELATARATPFEMHRDGILFVFSTEAGKHHVLDDLDVMAGHGYARPRVLSAVGARDLEPALSGSIVGAVLAETERHVYPPSLDSALSERLQRGGATVLPGTRVRSIVVNGGEVAHLETDAGTLAADAYVVAAGAWSARLARAAGFRLPVEAGKGYSISVSRPSLRLRRPLYLTEAKVAVSPFDDSLRLAGTMELSGVNNRLDRRRIEGIRRAAGAFLPPSWERGERVTEWVGMRPILPDGLPAIGRAPHLSNLYVGTGHGMLGVTLAPVTAVALADLICEGASEIDLQPFDPARFDQ